jgi:hypothetical protein
MNRRRVVLAAAMALRGRRVSRFAPKSLRRDRGTRSRQQRARQSFDPAAMRRRIGNHRVDHASQSRSRLCLAGPFVAPNEHSSAP